MRPFLSSNAQDFIEEKESKLWERKFYEFLSSNAQDFIEELKFDVVTACVLIPEQ